MYGRSQFDLLHLKKEKPRVLANVARREKFCLVAVWRFKPGTCRTYKSLIIVWIICRVVAKLEAVILGNLLYSLQKFSVFIFIHLNYPESQV